MSKQAKTTLATAAVAVTVLVGLLTLSKTVWASGGDYAVLEQRVTRLEHDRTEDSARLLRVERMVTRICARTPGCVE